MPRSKMPSDLNIANGWFFGKYAVEMYRDYDEIQKNTENKDKLIDRIFKETKRDGELSGTLLRVDAVLRIIENNQFEYCLIYLLQSKQIDQDAKLAAKDALTMLESGKLKQKPLK
jgi:hypothetical protein